ncbi:hypothetical protein [Botrimarina hoheduenensis]|uniref:Uncharacterized protein n=1 Tax=Botrimarina hoheduenensis TaxID=2528000 RepID=A0A5C5WAS1_9BACT|nr:hypothetical protein [Botrimarina hoheduenensis]TWT46702.1 hypothetical protein Pla111_18030 [Botrimarina hoheduenensis]
MLIAIFLGVVSLVVLVAAFLASKRWHWGSVLALVAFYFASVAFLILAAQTLNARNSLQKQVVDTDKRLNAELEGIDALESGTRVASVVRRLAGQINVADDATELASVGRMAHELRLKSRARGRVWRNAEPAGEVDLATGQVRVSFPASAPKTSNPDDPDAEPAAAEDTSAATARLDLEPESVVYLFEQGNANQQQYLGEFVVKEVDNEGRTALLLPLGQLAEDDYAADRLINSQGPWIVYESMPADSPNLFAGLSEKQLRKLLPESTVQEYLRDGTPAEADDDPERREPLDADGQPIPPGSETEPVSFRYRRLVRDYAFLLADSEQLYAELTALQSSARVEVERLREALAGAEKLSEFRKAQIEATRSDLVAVERDRDAIETHLNRLNEQLAQAETLLETTLQENAALAAQIASARGPMTPVVSPALDVDAL